MDIIASDKQAPPQASWPMYRALVGIGLLCTLLIVAVFLLTLPAIERNKAEQLRRAIFITLPGTTHVVTLSLTENQQFTASTESKVRGEFEVHAGFDKHDELVGLAIKADGMGYQDTITILYGYSPDQQAIVGMQVLQSKETPGLGDKIEKDPRFLANFDKLDVSLSENAEHISKPLQWVKSGHKKQAWQIDGITGATISSKAIAKMLSYSTQRWIPLLNRHIDDIRLLAPELVPQIPTDLQPPVNHGNANTLNHQAAVNTNNLSAKP